MAVETQVITFNNLLLSGDQSLTDLTNSISADAGLPPSAANIIRDVDGKLVRVDLTLPDATSQSAIDAIVNNKGVANVQACFPQLMLNDLDAANGIAIGGGFPALAAGQRIVASVFPLPSGFSGTIGILRSTGYTDFAALSSAGPVLIQVANFGVSGATDLVIPINATITLNHPGGPSVYTFQKALTLKAPSLDFTASYTFFLDDQGNLFVAFGRNADGSGNIFTEFPFDLDYLVVCQESTRKF